MKSLSLIEVLVVLGGIGFFLGGAYFAFNILLKANQDLSQKTTAMYLAAEAVEIVRNIRDTNNLQNAPFDANIPEGKDLIPVKNGETWELVDVSSDVSRKRVYFKEGEGFSQFNSSPSSGWEETKFSREIEIKKERKPTTNEVYLIKVKVIVKYGKFQKKYASIEDNFYKWQWTG